MPGRLLSNFVTNIAPSATKDLKKSLRNVSDKGRSTTSLNSDQFFKSEWSSVSGMDIFKRHKKHSTPEVEPHRPAKLDLVVESPALVSYNVPSQSSGALFSGQLRLNVLDPQVTFEAIELRLLCSVSVKKPVHQHCADCSTRTTELKKWSFLKSNEPLLLNQGIHSFPASYLFKGDLPATTHSHLLNLDYHFSALARPTTGENLTFSTGITLGRAVLPGVDRTSLRVFPPTSITAGLTCNPVIHARSEIPVSFKLSGVTSVLKNQQQVRWRLRRMHWRIDEQSRIFSPACAKHAPKAPDTDTNMDGAPKGVLHEDTRSLASRDVEYSKTPWKTNFSTGEIAAEFTCPLPAPRRGSIAPVNDLDSDKFGIHVRHVLSLELIVAEEVASAKCAGSSDSGTPTGAARILRTQFALVLSDRAGMGDVSWDEETPPVYQDVPASPPSYERADVSEVAWEEVEDLTLGEPRQGPVVVVPGARGGSRENVPGAPARWSVDDLMQEPNLPRGSAYEPEEDRN